jgi:hypothetical protein
MSEWTFWNTITAPPATGQVRLNHSTQKNATLMWIHKFTVNGNDATPYLTTIKQSTVLHLRDKDDVAKWQDFTVSGPPVLKTDYWEYPVIWQAGGIALVQQRIFVDIPTAHVSIEVGGFRLEAKTSAATVTGKLVTREFAYPFQGEHYISPGMTLRQYYVGQAITGFLASGGPIGNLIGKGAAYCFQVADSMIEYEAKQVGPPIFNLPPVPVASPPQAAPPQSAPETISLEDALVIQEQQTKAAE